MSLGIASSSGKESKLLDLSAEFVLSAGTVTIDPRSGPKVLLILDNQTREYMLPKGRKDIGETLAEAAVRETFEETGYKCRLKAHQLSTKATAGSSASGKHKHKHTEPIACQQRLTKKGVRKIIFWYVAEGDCTADKVVGTQDEGEDFTSLWLEAEMAIEHLTFEDDKKIARLALEAMMDTAS